MTRLWQKGDANGDATLADEELHAFMCGRDLVADETLLPFDLVATTAHVRGLARIGVLSESDCRELVTALTRLIEEVRGGRFVLDARFEDGHSAIEAWLSQELGELGRRVHLGRSRNDQVLVALRLYAKDRLLALRTMLARAATTFLRRAADEGSAVMPGYTHLQRAVPSTVGLWLAGLAEGLVDDMEMVNGALRVVDGCPLGTGAGYGVNLALDREGVARELGFSRVQWNPLAAQNSRGKLELFALGAFEGALLDARRFAWDLSLFSMQEIAFVRLPDRYTTGSSLMPNKRNPDVVELLRAAYGACAGARVDMATTLALPSGYQRDVQRTKGVFVSAVEDALGAMSVMARLAADFEIDAAAMRQAIDAPMFATDRAIELARQGVPFRDAYRTVAAAPPTIATSRMAEESVRSRVSPGACAELRLDAIGARLAALTEPS